MPGLLTDWTWVIVLLGLPFAMALAALLFIVVFCAAGLASMRKMDAEQGIDLKRARKKLEEHFQQGEENQK